MVTLYSDLLQIPVLLLVGQLDNLELKGALI